MNILIIGTTDVLGGAGKVSWEIKTALEKSGHSVSMFVADKKSTDKNVKIIARSKWRKVLGFLLATENFISTDWLLKTPEFIKADLVHCHNLHGRFFNLRTLAKMSKLKPVVWTLHDEWAITPHCAYTLEDNKIKNGLYVCPSINIPPRLLWNNSARLTKDRNHLYKNNKFEIVTPSLWLQDRVKKTSLGTQPQHLIYNGINTSKFTKSDKLVARQKLNLPLDKKIVLFLATAGKANTWKGWVYTEKVINHFKNDANILFLNVGNFIEEEPKINIIYRQHVNSEEELALYYSAADVLLCTSIAENFPLVVLEAMSCGLPIVSFKVGGIPEVLTHKENGYLCEYKNVDALISGVSWVLNQTTESLNELAKQSSAKIKTQFDVSNMTNAYFELYSNLLKP